MKDWQGRRVTGSSTNTRSKLVVVIVVLGSVELVTVDNVDTLVVVVIADIADTVEVAVVVDNADVVGNMVVVGVLLVGIHAVAPPV